MIQDLREIVRETGYLHETLGFLLNEYVKGSASHGVAYKNHLCRMQKQDYSKNTIEFYRHCFDSASSVYVLNGGVL